MKTFISLSALFLSLSLTAQTANWYFNNTSGSGIQTPFQTQQVETFQQLWEKEQWQVEATLQLWGFSPQLKTI